MPDSSTGYSASTLELLASDDCLAACTEKLFVGLQERFGFRRDELLVRKLWATVSRFGPADAVSWVNRMTDLDNGNAEWLELVETVTVHETFFFRDPAQLELLSSQGLSDLLDGRARQNERRLSVWSAGCASGEEAYTIAILVLSALARLGEDPKAWSIDVLGTDISAPMIAKARDGLYGASGLDSFRQMPPEYMFHFAPVSGEGPRRRRVQPELMSLVRFQRHNLMDDRPPCQDVDIVLCRNVMIYFDDARQAQTQGLLTKALAVGGLLLLGVTDRIVDAGQYARRQADNSVLYQKLG